MHAQGGPEAANVVLLQRSGGQQPGMLTAACKQVWPAAAAVATTAAAAATAAPHCDDSATLRHGSHTLSLTGAVIAGERGGLGSAARLVTALRRAVCARGDCLQVCGPVLCDAQAVPRAPRLPHKPVEAVHARWQWRRGASGRHAGPWRALRVARWPAGSRQAGQQPAAARCAQASAPVAHQRAHPPVTVGRLASTVGVLSGDCSSSGGSSTGVSTKPAAGRGGCRLRRAQMRP